MIKSQQLKGFWIITWGLYIAAKLLNILFGLSDLIVEITLYFAVFGFVVMFYNFFIRKKRSK